MACKRFNISIPSDLIKHVDKEAALDMISRSAYIREAIQLKLAVDSFIKSQHEDKNSEFNIIKAAPFTRTIRRSLNR